MPYGDIAQLDHEQRHVIKTIIRVGQKRLSHLPPEERRKAINTALAVGYTESRYRNLPGGDRDSQGWRQERAMYYKDPRNLKASVNRFYDEYLHDANRTAPLGVRAQEVQQSGTPHVWDSLAPLADSLRKRFSPKQKIGNGQASTSKPTRIPGVDNTAARQQLLLSYLDDRNAPDALLGLAQGLQQAQDVPGMLVPGRAKSHTNGREVVTKAGSVQKMLHKAVKWDKAKVPYLWGGGHGSTAKPGDQVDCSGFVSAVLGLKVPQVSGNLTQYGKPGKGKWVTVYANDGHTFMSIRDPKTHKVRWFGTSHSNPGGGAGEISPPPASYLSQFVARHPG